MSGRLLPSERYKDRWALTEALLPIVRSELVALADAGCREITVDEPSMSCYAHREDPKRFVDIFNRTVEPAAGRCHLSTHLCFGNYKARAVGPRRYAPMFPHFLDMKADEIHRKLTAAPDGLTRAAIYNMFGRNRSRDEIGAALGDLLNASLARSETRATGGRPEERWFSA